MGARYSIVNNRIVTYVLASVLVLPGWTGPDRAVAMQPPTADDHARATHLVVDLDSVTPTVIELVSARTGIDVTSVSCTENIPLQKGETFECHAEGGEGAPIVVNIEIEDDEGGFLANVIDPLAMKELLPRVKVVMAAFVAGEAVEVYDRTGPEIRDSMTREDFVAFVADRFSHLGASQGETTVEAAFINRAQGEGRLLEHSEFENGRLTGSWTWRREHHEWILYGFSFRESQ